MMPPLVSNHFPNQFFRTLQQFRDARYLCDVRLIADGEIEFPAHRLVLAISSPFFSDLFQSKKDAQDVTTVHLRNCSAECVQILLQYLYSGELQLKECDPGKVLSVARACRIGSLEQMLASYATTATPSPPIATTTATSTTTSASSPTFLIKESDSPKHHYHSPSSTVEQHSPMSGGSGGQQHGHKRKAKATVAAAPVSSTTTSAIVGDQFSKSAEAAAARKSSTSKNNNNHSYSSATTQALLNSVGARLLAPTIQTPSSIFMQNGMSTTMCPIHGMFACGCPLLALAAANNMANANSTANDLSMAAAIQQLFFGAAAAAQAAAAANAANAAAASQSTPSSTSDNGHNDNGSPAINGNHEDEIGGGITYGASLPKMARHNAKANGIGNGGGGIFGGGGHHQQNGDLHCQLPTTPATIPHHQILSPTEASIQRVIQQHMGSSNSDSAALTRQRSTSDMSSTAAATPPDHNQPQQQGGDRGSLNTVQVPADDKEGWCRNKKYIKKTPQGYQCTVCKKTYGRYNSVSYHVTIYHRNPPIQCDQPGCTFSTREARYIHFHKYYRHDVALPTNIDLESRRCPFCKHVAKSPAMLEKHINRHMPEGVRIGKTYHCDLCKKELASRHALLQHMMAHENEKGLACDQCSYRGRTTENLQQHKMFKHSNAGDLWCTKLQCGECQYSTPSQSQLDAHQRNVHHQKDDGGIGEDESYNNGVVSSTISDLKEEGDEMDEDDLGSDDPNGVVKSNENGHGSDEEFLLEHEEDEINASNDDECAAFPYPIAASESADEIVDEGVDDRIMDEEEDDGRLTNRGSSSPSTEPSPAASV